MQTGLGLHLGEGKGGSEKQSFLRVFLGVGFGRPGRSWDNFFRTKFLSSEKIIVRKHILFVAKNVFFKLNFFNPGKFLLFSKFFPFGVLLPGRPGACLGLFWSFLVVFGRSRAPLSCRASLILRVPSVRLSSRVFQTKLDTKKHQPHAAHRNPTSLRAARPGNQPWTLFSASRAPLQNTVRQEAWVCGGFGF